MPVQQHLLVSFGSLRRKCGDQGKIILPGQAAQLLHSRIKGFPEKLLLGGQLQLAAFHRRRRRQPFPAFFRRTAPAGQQLQALLLRRRLRFGRDGIDFILVFLLHQGDLPFGILYDARGDLIDSFHRGLLSAVPLTPGTGSSASAWKPAAKEWRRIPRCRTAPGPWTSRRAFSPEY